MRRMSLAALLAAAFASGCGMNDPSGGLPDAALVPSPAFPAGEDVPKTAYDAAVALQALLSDSEAQLVYPVGSALRRNWTNLPPSNARFDPNGVRLGAMSPAQLAALYEFLAVSLGPHGYDAVAQVVAAEAFLAQSWLERLDGTAPAEYRFAFFGEPSRGTVTENKSQRWGWQFSGHHLVFNASYEGERLVSLSPSFVGVEPMRFEHLGHRYAPLVDEIADALALLRALPEDARRDVLVDAASQRDHAGAGRDGVIPPAEGGLVAAWPESAQGMLLDLASHWVRLRPEEQALERLAAIEAGLAETRFAWFGPTDGSGDFNYRIQGPSLIIEVSNEGGSADDSHVHSVYRDPTNEYGGAL